MTLILTLRSNDWVAMAADRMISNDGGRPIPRKAVKMVVFYNDLVIGYTGLAQLLNAQGQLCDTDKWLVDVLISVGKRSLLDAINAIRDNATETFERMRSRFPTQKNWHHAFLALYWGADPNDVSPTLSSGVLQIDNCYWPDAQGCLAPGNVRYDFQLNARFFKNEQGISFDYTGYPQSKEELNWLETQVGIESERGTSVIKLLDLMKQSIRQTSLRLHNRFVGQDVLASIIPKKAVSQDRVIIGSPQMGALVYFGNSKDIHFPLDYQDCSHFMRYAPGRNDPIYEAPHVVAPGFKFSGIFGPKEGKREVEGYYYINPITRNCDAWISTKFNEIQRRNRPGKKRRC